MSGFVTLRIRYCFTLFSPPEQTCWRNVLALVWINNHAEETSYNKSFLIFPVNNRNNLTVKNISGPIRFYVLERFPKYATQFQVWDITKKQACAEYYTVFTVPNLQDSRRPSYICFQLVCEPPKKFKNKTTYLFRHFSRNCPTSVERYARKLQKVLSIFPKRTARHKPLNSSSCHENKTIIHRRRKSSTMYRFRGLKARIKNPSLLVD